MSELAPHLAAFATLLATYLLHSTLAIGLVWLLERSGYIKSHSLAEQLWKGAALAGLITAPVQVFSGWTLPGFDFTVAQQIGAASADDGSAEPRVPLDALRDTGDSTENVITESESVPLTTTPLRDLETDVTPLDLARSSALSADDANVDLNDRRGEVHEFAPADNSPEEPAPANWRERTVVGIAAIASLAMLFAFVRLAVQSASFGSVFRRMTVCEAGSAREALNELLARAAIRRRVRLYSTNQLDEPAAFGLLRWSIVLPAGLERRLPREQLTALLAHEVAHLVRGDVLWLWFGRVLCTALAVQPLNRLARRQWRSAAEYQCDDWAVGQNVAPLALARCLTSVAEWRQPAAIKSILAAASNGLWQPSFPMIPGAGRYARSSPALRHWLAWLR